VVLYGASDRNRHRLQPAKTNSLAAALAVFIFIASAPHAQAQLPTSAAKPPAKAEPTARIDPLERETPRSAMTGFLKYALLENYETAARFARRP
jgi:hypothetical protein